MALSTIFKIENPARSLMPFLLAGYMTYGTTVPGMLSCYMLLYAFIFVSYFILNYSRCTIWYPFILYAFIYLYIVFYSSETEV